TVKAATLIARGQAAVAVLSPNVAALTEGVLKSVFLLKLKLASTGLFGTALGAAGAGMTLLPTPYAEGGAGSHLESPTDQADQAGPNKVQGEPPGLPALSGSGAEPERRETPPPGEQTPIKDAGQDVGVPPPPAHKAHHAKEPRGSDRESGHHPDG